MDSEKLYKWDVMTFFFFLMLLISRQVIKSENNCKKIFFCS